MCDMDIGCTVFCKIKSQKSFCVDDIRPTFLNSDINTTISSNT